MEYIANEPNSDTVFHRIKRGATIENLAEIVRKNRPKIRHPITVAIDVHDQMYWGEKAPYVVGTEPKNGSFHAYKFLMAKSVDGNRSVLDIAILDSGSVVDKTIIMLDNLLKEYKIKTVLMDGAFPSSMLIAYLNSKNIGFVCRFRSTSKLRRMDILYKKPYLYKTMYKNRSDRPNTVESEYYIYRYRGKGFDYYLISDMKADPREIRVLFKKRWGIETGFRDLKRLRIKTTTRNYLLRLLFFIIASIIYNLWILLKDRFGIRLNIVKSGILQRISEMHKIRFRQLSGLLVGHQVLHGGLGL